MQAAHEAATGKFQPSITIGKPVAARHACSNATMVKTSAEMRV
jgi:hypothetical protein